LEVPVLFHKHVQLPNDVAKIGEGHCTGIIGLLPFRALVITTIAIKDAFQARRGI
jgi:hypothetical protein